MSLPKPQSKTTAECGTTKEAVPLLSAASITKVYGRQGWLSGGKSRPVVHAVDDVTLHVRTGETVGIVGESGSGKSTLARLLCGLVEPTAGDVEFDGTAVTARRGSVDRSFRRAVQMIFQDPFGSLDPTKTVGHAIAEPLLVHKLCGRSEGIKRATTLAGRVALNPDIVARYPHQLSGGQRQRVAIARALALEPQVLIADEPTSALDLSTQSEILNLLLDLQESDGLAIVLVSHDFSTIRHLSHRVVVMYGGIVVESGDAARVTEDAQHPYTAALLSAVPLPDPNVQRHRKRIPIGASSSVSVGRQGCPFANRCPVAEDRCRTERPLLTGDLSHQVACHFPERTITMTERADDITEQSA